MQRMRFGVVLAVVAVALAAPSTARSGAAPTNGSPPAQRGAECRDFGIYVLAVPGAGETGKRGGTAGALARRTVKKSGGNDDGVVEVLRWSPREPTVKRIPGYPS